MSEYDRVASKMRRPWPNKGCIVQCKHKRLRIKRPAVLKANSLCVSKSEAYHIYIANIHILTAGIMNIMPLLYEKKCVLLRRRQRVTGMCWRHLQVK